jgi:hypothetical protein
MTTPNESEAKKKRTRSPGYPTIDLREALEKAKTVWENDRRNETPISSLAVQWGYNAKSSSAVQLAAALKKFGLFVEVPNKNAFVRLSDLAIRILTDEDPTSIGRTQLIKRAALTPRVYNTIWTQYQGNLPSNTTLKSYLLADLKFNPDVVDDVIKSFRSTISFAKLAPDDSIQTHTGSPPNLEEMDADGEANGASSSPAPTSAPKMTAQPTSTAPAQAAKKQMRFELDSGPVLVNYPMSQEDFDLLLKSLDLWKKKLVSQS